MAVEAWRQSIEIHAETGDAAAIGRICPAAAWALLGSGRWMDAYESYPGSVTNEQLALITSDPSVLHGQARVPGTRVTGSVVLDCLAAGMSETEILAEYPS